MRCRKIESDQLPSVGLISNGLEEPALKMHRYPTISVAESHFAIVDGFLVRLCSRDVHEVGDSQTVAAEVKQKVSHLVSLHKPDMLLKMDSIASNFYITDHSLLFEILKEKVYVNFVKTRGRYYCRKMNRNKATHVAVSVRVTRGKGTRSSKYVVYKKPLGQQLSTLPSIIEQQEEDLAHVDVQKIESFFRGESPEGAAQELDVKLFSEEDIMHLLHSPAVLRPIEQVPEYLEERRRLATENFKKIVLDFCGRRSIYKLNELTQILHKLSTHFNDLTELKKLHTENEAMMLTNLSLASERIFPVLLEYLSHSDTSQCVKISDRFAAIDGLLIDIQSKTVLDPRGTTFSNTATAQEKRSVKKHSFISWSVICSETKTLKIRTQTIFDLVDQTPKDSPSEVEMDQKEQKSSPSSKLLTQHLITLDFERLGQKRVFVEVVDVNAEKFLENRNFKAAESLKLAASRQDHLSPFDLMESYKQFCSYEEQEKLYLETIKLLVAKGLS